MSQRVLDPQARIDAQDEDWDGNNAAFTCPLCGKVFIVSQLLHKGVRSCPKCKKSKGHCTGGRKSGGKAFIEW